MLGLGCELPLRASRDGDLLILAGLTLAAEDPLDPQVKEWVATRHAYPLGALPDLLEGLRAQASRLCAAGHELDSVRLSSGEPGADQPWATASWWLDPDEDGRAGVSLSGRVDLPARHRRTLEGARRREADFLIGAAFLCDRSFEPAFEGLQRARAALEPLAGRGLRLVESNASPGNFFASRFEPESRARRLELLLRTDDRSEVAGQVEERRFELAPVVELLRRTWRSDRVLAALAVGAQEPDGSRLLYLVTQPEGSPWTPGSAAELQVLVLHPPGGEPAALTPLEVEPLHVRAGATGRDERVWRASLPDGTPLSLAAPFAEQCTGRWLAEPPALYLRGARHPTIAGWGLDPR